MNVTPNSDATDVRFFKEEVDIIHRQMADPREHVMGALGIQQHSDIEAPTRLNIPAQVIHSEDEEERAELPHHPMQHI